MKFFRIFIICGSIILSGAAFSTPVVDASSGSKIIESMEDGVRQVWLCLDDGSDCELIDSVKIDHEGPESIIIRQPRSIIIREPKIQVRP